MTDTFDNLDRAELKSALATRAWKDSQFKALLMRDGRAALSQLLGSDLPAGMRFTVLEERADQVCLVLPYAGQGGAEPADDASTGEADDAEAAVIARAVADPAFKQWLLRTPRVALEDTLGVPLPAGISVTVLEESLGERYLVLPPAPTGDTSLRELSDVELASVAGGGRTYRPRSRNTNGQATHFQESLRRWRGGDGAC